ncbi:MAG: hypothetical protein ACRC6V_13385 [Bacteroidales bacterium]
MANFFKGVENLLKHPIDEIKWMADETKGVLKPLLKGDVSESWDSFKGSFGRHNDMMEDITVPLGGRNKITENPDAAAGAVVGSFLAAPAIAGAMGGSSGSSIGGFGSEGAFSKMFQPMTNKVGSMWDSLTGSGVKDLNSLYGNVDFDDAANDDLLGLISDVEGEIASGKKGGKELDLEAIGKMLQSIKQQPDYKIQSSGGMSGRGFKFDQEPYKHKASQKEFAQLYGSSPGKQ